MNKRRTLVAALGAMGIAPLAWTLRPREALGVTTPLSGPTGIVCTLSPSMTEGPYFVDERLNLSLIHI